MQLRTAGVPRDGRVGVRRSPAPPARRTAVSSRSPRRRGSATNAPIEAFARAAEYLGQVLADFAMVMDISLLMVGGGVSEVGPALLGPLQESLDRHLDDVVESVTVLPAAMGADSGVIGAAHWSRLVHNGGTSHSW